MALKIIISGICFIVAIISGVWLSKTSRPLNQFVFTVHKLVAIAIIVLLIIVLRSLFKDTIVEGWNSYLMISTGTSLFVLLLSGALLSFNKFETALLKWIHKIFSFLLFVGIAWLLQGFVF